MRCLFCAVLPLVVLFGCAAHTKDIYLSRRTEDKHLREVNRETGGRTVHLVLRDGRSFPARGAVVLPDSTFWHVPDSGKEIAVSTAEVHRIAFKSMKNGAKRGMIIGALIGLPMGALITDRAPGSDGIVSDRIQAALAGGLGTALWGAGIGAFVGRQTTYFFHVSEEREAVPDGP